MPAVNYEHKLECLRERMKRSEDLSDEDRETLSEFWRDLQIQDYSKARIYKLINTLTIVAEQMGADLDEAEEDDIKGLIAWVNSRDLSGATKTDYRIIVKRFYKWLNGGEEYPECVDWIRTTLNGRKNKILPKDMLKEEEIRDLIGAAYNSRDRALVAILWETGARIGEILDADVGDIEEHKHGRMIVIDGKTGPRRLPLISSTPHLKAWLTGHHPRGKDRDAPLFVNVHTNPGGG